MVSEQYDPAAPGDKTRVIMAIEDGKVRVEMRGPEGNRDFIFREDRREFYSIDHTERTVRVMTEEDLERLNSQMEEASQMLEEQMQNMPSDQRSQMEGMMDEMTSQMGGGQQPISYTRAASGVRVGSWSTDHYVGRRGGNKVREVWTTRADQLSGFARADRETLRAMQDFFANIAESFMVFFDGSSAEGTDPAYRGIPVKTEFYSDGSVSRVVELKTIERASFGSGHFAVPGGYSRKSMME
jgi:hypothetical protein